MEQKSLFSTRGIVGWDNDLEKLKRVRHIRNNLVHEPDCNIDYDESDIVFIRDFYNRILNQQDPLAMLRKQTEQIKRVKPQLSGNDRVYQKHNSEEHENNSNGNNKRDSKFLKGLLIAIGIVVLIGLLILVIIAVRTVIA